MDRSIDTHPSTSPGLVHGGGFPPYVHNLHPVDSPLVDISAEDRAATDTSVVNNEVRDVATHCPYCSLQCRLRLARDADGLRTWPVSQAPGGGHHGEESTNLGGLCIKGWTAAELLAHPDRLRTPQMRAARDQPLQPCSWDEALTRIVTEVKHCQQRYGADSVGVFGGGGLTNEKAYLLGKFARVALRTANVDYNGRFCMSSAATAMVRSLGIDRGLPFPLEDIAAADAVLLVGSNVAETMPPVMQHFARQQDRGGSLIVIDPRVTLTAQAATLHLQNTPGSDLALANGLLHTAIKEGLVDEEYVATRTNGFAGARRVAQSYWPDRVERITGITPEQLRTTVRLLARPAKALVLSGRGPEQQTKGTETTLAFVNLALALGQVGRIGSGFGTLTGQGNGQGGREHGLKNDQLPGYRRLDEPAARSQIAQVWGVDEETLPQPGRSAYELLDSLGTEGSVRALLVMGSNPAVSAPSAGHVREGLSRTDFLCVTDPFVSETAAMADVVLPCTQWAEEDGTMTSLEGRVLRRRLSLARPVGVRSDLEILTDLAARLGRAEQFPSADPRVVFEELRRASAGGTADYAGISLDRIDDEGQGMFWPCPSEEHPGTPRLFLDRFPTSDGFARFHVVPDHPLSEEPDDDYPLWLTTGRVLQHYQSGTQTRRVTALAAAEPHAYVEIHPQTAARHGIEGGQEVQVTTRRGSVVLRARLTQAVRIDTVFAPFHWGDAQSVNLITSPALDPLSKMPELKACAARIQPLGAPVQDAHDQPGSSARPRSEP